MVGIGLEEGITELLKNTAPISDTEEVELLNACDRTLAENIIAPFSQPPFDRSPLDGYTFNSIDSAQANKNCPVEFKVIGEVCAGQVFYDEVKVRQAVRIMTGAPIPAGCDCVVRQEQVECSDGVMRLEFPLKHYENYCFAGEDIKQGNLLMEKGALLKAAHIGTLASMGYAKVRVYRRLKVAICSTGDELMRVGTKLLPGKIYNSNLYALAARLKELGCEPVIMDIAADEPEAVADKIRAERGNVDLLLTTGGVSVGKKDIIHDVIKLLGAKRLFWRVMMKPGTPILSYVFDNQLCIGLSGNPFAALATFELLVRPVLAKMSNQPAMQYCRSEAVLGDDFPKESKGRRFIRGREVDGIVHIPTDIERHSSGSLFSAVNCNSMIDIPAGTGALTKGTRVQLVRL